MAFKDLYKDELWEAVRHYKIDVDANANKDTLTAALLDKGISAEQWEEDKAAKDGQPRPAAVTETEEDLLPEPTAVEDTADEDFDVDVPEEDEMVLVRFIGRNRSYTIGKWTFGVYRPFALMKKDEFEALDRKKFREANKAEAREYFS